MVYQYSWISRILSNHVIKNSTIQVFVTKYILYYYIYIHNVCMDYSRGSTNLGIHENTIFPQTTNISIHEIRCIHSYYVFFIHLPIMTSHTYIISHLYTVQQLNRGSLCLLAIISDKILTLR